MNDQTRSLKVNNNTFNGTEGVVPIRFDMLSFVRVLYQPHENINSMWNLSFPVTIK